MSDLRICPLARLENISTLSDGREYVNIWMISNRNAKVKKVLTFLDGLATHDAKSVEQAYDLIITGEATEAFWAWLAGHAGVNPLKTSRDEIKRRLIAREAS